MTSDTPTLSNGRYCPGPVTFTCIGTSILPVLTFTVNGNHSATYGYVDEITNQDFNVPFRGQFPGVVFRVVRAILLRDLASINATGILTVEDISTLRGSPVSCSSVNIRNTTTIIQVQPPPCMYAMHHVVKVIACESNCDCVNCRNEAPY